MSKMASSITLSGSSSCISSHSTSLDQEMPPSGPSGLSSQHLRWHRTWESNRGMVLVLLGEIFRAGMMASTKVLEMDGVDGKKGMGTLQILFARFSITLVLSSAYMYSAGTADFPWGAKGVRSLLWLRGFFGFFGIYSAYYSLHFLPLAESVVIGFLAPLLTVYATSMVLHTTFSSSQIVASITAFLGVVIIADPFSLYQSGVAMLPGDSSDSIPSQLILENLSSVSIHRNLAIAIGLFSALVTACGFTTIRLVGDRAHVLIQVNYYSMVSTIISGLALVLPMPHFPFLGDTSFCFPATLREWILLAYIGISGFMLQFLMTAGLQADSSSRATNMMYSQIIFALCLDWGIWGQIPGWGSAFGGAVVIGAVIWSSLGKTEVIPKKVNHDAYTAIEMDEDEIGFHDEDSIRREQV